MFGKDAIGDADNVGGNPVAGRPLPENRP